MTLADVFEGRARWTVEVADCRYAMSCMADASVDAIVCDPPYELNFMNRKWDSSGIAFNVEVWREALRVLKPGGHLLAFGGTRTYHRLACAVEDAGFEIRDSIAYLYGSGFPKSLNVRKALGSTCCECADAHNHMSDLRDEIRDAANPVSEAEILLPKMLGANQSGASHGDRPFGAFGLDGKQQGRSESEDVRATESGMEGRGYVLSEARQLQTDQIRSVPGGVLCDGAEGRLRDGAPDHYGADGSSPALSGRGSAPCGSQPTEQFAGELGALAGQPEPQIGGAWTICGRCGKPVVPSGIGTALKPAFEPVIVARKPLDGTVAANWLKHGTGALNIDGCRIGDEARISKPMGGPANSYGGYGATATATATAVVGRWPANVALAHCDECERIGTRQVRPSGAPSGTGSPTTSTAYGKFATRSMVTYADGDGLETVESWQCAPGCPVAELDAQSGSGTSKPFPENVATGAVLPFTFRSAGGYSDTGGASRFFFTAKASRAERDAGLDDFEPRTGGAATGRPDETEEQRRAAGLNSPRAGAGRNGGARNIHPTIKPVDLMRWLVRLVSRPGSLILDPFCGSGTTGVATMLEGEGRRFIGLELEPLHVDFARARIAHKIGGTFEREVIPERPYEKRQLSIFDRISGHDEALP